MKKDYIFNTIAGLINAAEAVIMSMIITRTTGLTDAGYVTIAFAVGNLLMTIGKYGVYSFQVTDHNNEYNFPTYVYTRIITIIAMLISLAGYLIYGYLIMNYTLYKISIILFIGLIYAIEAFEDLIKAQCQYIGKLYIGSLIFIIRWTAIIITFSASIIITYNTSKSIGIAFVISIITFIICYCMANRLIGTSFSSVMGKTCYLCIHLFDQVKSLLKACFPLFLSSFLSFYIVNSSKYALERYMDANTQACFGFVAMPVFAIELLNSFIYQPLLVHMAEDYNSNQIDSFKAMIKKQYTIITLLTIVSLITAYYIGIPFLSLLYHTDLSNYLHELLILLLGGGFLALSGYQGVILTIMRRQKYQLYGYIFVAILAFIFVGQSVRKNGTISAAISYLILIMILSILYEFFIRRELANGF